MVNSTADMFRVGTELHMTDCCPACVNDSAMAELVRRVAAEVVGSDRVLQATRTTGADDMSLFLQETPGCYFFVGAGNAEKGLSSPHHSPTFDFDEQALEVGVAVLSRVALEFLEQV
jgi:amidohydrolase